MGSNPPENVPLLNYRSSPLARVERAANELAELLRL